VSQANSIQTVTSRVRVNSSGGAKNEFIDAKIRAKCLIISQSCIPAITLEAAALTPTAGSCTIGLTLIPSHSGLRSESISWPVSPTLDNLVGEHASPTLTDFSVMHIYEVRPRSDKRGFDLIPVRYHCPRPASQDRARTVFNGRVVDVSGHDVINESCTLYGERRFVIECPAPSTTIFLAMKNSIIFISALSLVAMMLASCNSIPSAFAPDETATTGATRQTNETRPERSAENSVNSMSGGHH